MIQNVKNILQFALDNGILCLSDIQGSVEDMQRAELLESRSRKIWQGNDGKWRTYIVENDKRKLIVRKDKADLEKFVIDYEDLQAAEPTFESCFKNWSKQKLDFGEIQKATYDRYVADFKRYFSSIADNKIKDISEYDLEDYIKKSIHDMRLSAKNWGNMRIVLMGTFIYAKKNGFTDLTIVSFLKELQLSSKIFKHKAVKDETQVFTDAEESAIEDFVNRNGRSIIDLGILLTFNTGLRVGELSSLMHKDVKGNTLTVERTEIKYIGEDGERVTTVRQDTKGKEGCRCVVLTDKALEIIREVMDKNPNGMYLFCDEGRRIPAKAFSHRISTICKALGLEHRSFHKIRKTYATKLIQGGIEEKIIEKQMGHTDILTTKRYYYFSNQQVDDIKDKLESVI